MPIIISTKEVLRNIYSNGHALPKIKKGITSKKTIQRKMPISINIGNIMKTPSPDGLTKTQQLRIISNECRQFRPSTTNQLNCSQHKKMLRQFDDIKI
jgi:hypothetical protein